MIRLLLVTSLLLAPAVSTHADDTLARHDYVLTCAGCHGFDGRGSDQVPSLRELAPLLTAAGGRTYLVRVPGVAQAPLSSERLAGLLNWLMGHFSGVAVTPGFTQEEVADLRAAPLRDPVATRERLMGSGLISGETFGTRETNAGN